MANRIVIGLVGQPSVGKDTLANYWRDTHDFEHVSSGDILRSYIQNNNLGELTRENLQFVGNELRKEKGGDYLVKKALEFTDKNVVISGLRATGEIGAVKACGGVIVALVASFETRYRWAKERGRVSDRVTIDQFKVTEEKEFNGGDAVSQNLKAVLAGADCTISNDGTKEDLYQKADQIIKMLAPHALS